MEIMVVKLFTLFSSRVFWKSLRLSFYHSIRSQQSCLYTTLLEIELEEKM